MNTRDIIRAWKDEHFRKSLTSDQQALLPENPAGELVLSEAEMARVNGGATTTRLSTCEHTSAPLCTVFPKQACL
jgi:mersacidin/lichenicidin family type 2 lantibiotic